MDRILSHKYYLQYSVLTYIFGNYECLHEIQNKREDVEYVCVTDNKNLKSDTWKIVYDDISRDFTPFRKVIETRYNPFKYVSNDICIVLDGSIQINKFPLKLVNHFRHNDYDIGTLIHPSRDNIINELDAWKNIRNLSQINILACKTFLNSISYDFNYKGLFQVGIILIKKSEMTQRFLKKILDINNSCAASNDSFRVDQIIFSAILNKMFSKCLKVLPLSSHELHGNYFTYFVHNSNQSYGRIDIQCMADDVKFMFNEKTVCNYIDRLPHDNKLTAAICNFNTSDETNNVIDNILKMTSVDRIVVLDNSDKENFKVQPAFANKVLVIDNTTGKYINFQERLKQLDLSDICKINNYASLKHAMSIEFLLNIIDTKYLMICDSDIRILNKINFIEDNYLTICDVEYTGTASQNMNLNTGKTRFTPFLQVFNIDMMNQYKIKYLDLNRIHGTKKGMLYDTGASLYEDAVNKKIPFKIIHNNDYIYHKGHGSWMKDGN